MARQRIELRSEEAEELSRRVRATTVSVRDRRRAEIILLSAQGLTQQRIAEQMGISRLVPQPAGQGAGAVLRREITMPGAGAHATGSAVGERAHSHEDP